MWESAFKTERFRRHIDDESILCELSNPIDIACIFLKYTLNNFEAKVLVIMVKVKK